MPAGGGAEAVGGVTPPTAPAPLRLYFTIVHSPWTWTQSILTEGDQSNPSNYHLTGFTVYPYGGGTILILPTVVLLLSQFISSL